MAAFKLNRRGVAQILKGPKVKAAVDHLAEQIASDLDSEFPGSVLTGSFVTDRARATVTVFHPDAQGRQAVDGILTRTAAAHGLEVKGDIP